MACQMVETEKSKNKFPATTTTQGPKCLKVKNCLIKIRVKEADPAAAAVAQGAWPYDRR